MADESLEINDMAGGIDSTVAIGEIDAGEEELDEGFTRAEIRRNLTLLLIINVLAAGAGNAGYVYPMVPLLKHYEATNAMIGMVQGAGWAAIIGNFIIPYISRLFRIKKWFLLAQCVINNGPLMLMGLMAMYPTVFHITPTSFLRFILIVSIFNNFTSGLFNMPFYEMIMGSMPRSHIGRMNGLSSSLGNGLSIIAMAGATWLTRVYPGSKSLGFLILMCGVVGVVTCFLFPLLREKPSHAKDAPMPWSKSMFAAAWENKPFIRLLGVNTFGALTVGDIAGFISVYGIEELKMSASDIGVVMTIGLVVTLVSAAPVGFLIDKFGAKKMLPLSAFGGVIAYLCLILMRSQWGVYAAGFAGGLAGAVGVTSLASLFYILPKNEHRNGHFTLQWTSTYGTASLGLILTGQILEHHFPFRSLFMVGVVISLIMYPLYKWAVAPIPDKKSVTLSVDSL